MQKITADLSELPRNFGPDIIASRVETGPLQINDDWPMVAIRGDNAAWYAMQLDIAINKLSEMSLEDTDFGGTILISSLKSLSELFKSCLIK